MWLSEGGSLALGPSPLSLAKRRLYTRDGTIRPPSGRTRRRARLPKREGKAEAGGPRALPRDHDRASVPGAKPSHPTTLLLAGGLPKRRSADMDGVRLEAARPLLPRRGNDYTPAVVAKRATVACVVIAR